MRESQEIAILTSRLTTRVGLILTSKANHLFNSFGISTRYKNYRPRLKDLKRIRLEQQNAII
jgi:hypothetical protein